MKLLVKTKKQNSNARVYVGQTVTWTHTDGKPDKVKFTVVSIEGDNVTISKDGRSLGLYFKYIPEKDDWFQCASSDFSKVYGYDSHGYMCRLWREGEH